MHNDKLAAIMNGLSPVVSGARPPKGAPTASLRPSSSTPGLGAKMRTETGRALEHALSRGQSDALTHFGLKSAALPLAKPIPSGFMPPIKRALGYGALAAGGAAALGLHRQNQTDQAAKDLVYVPLGGLA